MKYTDEEKLNYLMDFFKSGTNVYNYCINKNIPRTTFRMWLNKYNKNITMNMNNTDNITNNSFCNITELANDVSTSISITTKSNDNIISDIKVNDSPITLTLPNIGELHFSISQLKQVMEVLK